MPKGHRRLLDFLLVGEAVLALDTKNFKPKLGLPDKTEDTSYTRMK